MLDRLKRRARALFNRNAAETDLDDELRFHLDMETDYQMRMGHPEKDARRIATREFGGVERYRDESRDARGVSMFEDIGRDMTVAMRGLRRTPGFALISIFTVALGIGMTTAVFSIIDGILLRPLPYPNADQLIRIYERNAKYPANNFTGPNYYDLERVAKSLRVSAYYGSATQTVLGLSQPVSVTQAFVSDRFFDVLGVRPEVGRGFVPGGATGEDVNAVVVSDRFWREWLNGRADWQNATIQVEDGSYRVIGVMPPGFSYPTGADVWTPLHDQSTSRTSHNWSVIGRLRDGRSADETKAELDQYFGALKMQLGKEMDAEGVSIRSLREALTFKVKTLCYVLLAAVGLVLLVACTNLASANLARGESQQREIAVRVSLGVSRMRLVRQLATEKVVLCLVGGLVGVALSWLFVRVATALGVGTIPAFASVRVDTRVLAFGLAIALLTGLVTGILPAFRVTSDLRRSTTSGGGGAGKRSLMRGPLIIAEVALATVLVIGSGLFVRSFRTLLSEDPGFRVEQVVLGDVTLPTTTYRSPTGWYGDTVGIARFFTQALDQLRRVPGVTAVSVANQAPLNGGGFNTGLALDGSPDAGKAGAEYRVVDSAYFQAMGIPLIRGRAFTSADRSGSQQVAIINREAADKFWPGANPIGHRLLTPGMDLHGKEWLTVVGVVENTRDAALDQPRSPIMYVHYLQRPERMMSGTFVVRASQPQLAGAAISAVISQVDRNALVKVRPMQDLLDQSVATRRFSMTVLTTFSALALFLAAVGIYGVLAYAVVQRQREIGIRMALGLTRGGVGQIVLRDAMTSVVPGVVIGLIGAWAATRFIQGMLYGIAAVDPATFVATPVVILLVALLASLWPASRAARVDPLIAMRAE
jgi:putative ABC transport system permease protein